MKKNYYTDCIESLVLKVYTKALLITCDHSLDKVSR